MRLLIRYGEIGLKSAQVQSKFEHRLRENLQQKLDAKDIDGDILDEEGRIFARVPDAAAADATLALSHVPGVVSLSPVAVSALSMDAIIETADNVFASARVPETETFAVDARRAGDHDFTSKDIENEVGQAIVDEHGLDVDLDDPDLTVYVEARYRNAYVYTEVVDGVGGLPINERNRVIVHMTDRASTVAAFRLMKRGCTVYPVYTGNDADVLEEDMDTLRKFDPSVKLTVLDVDWDTALEQACDLFDADAVAVGHTVEELDERDVPALSPEVLLPNCGMETEDVLSTYQRIRHVSL